MFSFASFNCILKWWRPLLSFNISVLSDPSTGRSPLKNPLSFFCRPGFTVNSRKRRNRGDIEKADCSAESVSLEVIGIHYREFHTKKYTRFSYLCQGIFVSTRYCYILEGNDGLLIIFYVYCNLIFSSINSIY